jgi:hypothetical protein
VFLRQHRDLMQLVLLGAAIVSMVALQKFSTGLVIIGLTVLNASRRERRASRCAGGPVVTATRSSPARSVPIVRSP